MLAMGYCYPVIELDNGIRKVLGHNAVAYVGKSASAWRGSRAASKAKQQQARPNGVCVGDSERRTEGTNAAVEGGSVLKSDPVCTDTSFVQYAGSERVGPHPYNIVNWSMCKTITQNQ